MGASLPRQLFPTSCAAGLGQTEELELGLRAGLPPAPTRCWRQPALAGRCPAGGGKSSQLPSNHRRNGLFQLVICGILRYGGEKFSSSCNVETYFHFLQTLEEKWEHMELQEHSFHVGEFLGPRGPLIEPSIPVPSRPSTRPPAPIFPEFIDELKHCCQASGNPQTIHSLKAHDVSYPTSEENSNTETNTKTNTDTNTKTETNKGRS